MSTKDWREVCRRLLVRVSFVKPIAKVKAVGYCCRCGCSCAAIACSIPDLHKVRCQSINDQTAFGEVRRRRIGHIN